jgi:hypothetical protein
MNLFKKTSLKLSILLLTIMSLLGTNLTVTKAATNENPNEIFYDVSVRDLKIGEPVTTYRNLDTGVRLEIELISVEEPDLNIITPYGYGNTGWSAGTIPAYSNMTLVVRADTSLVESFIVDPLEYRLDVNGITKTMKAAYGLAYFINTWTMQTTSLSITNPTATSSSPARSEFNYTAVLIEYGVVVGSAAGYLNFEIDYNGHVRTYYYI